MSETTYGYGTAEWEQFHPRARLLLNDEIYWNLTHASAPHGSSTGSDALALFLEHKESFRNRPASAFAYELLKSWKIKPIDWLECRPEKVQAMLESNDIILLTCNETMIAAAFARIKAFGRCDESSNQLALLAIERESLDCIMSFRNWRDPEERRKHLAMYSQCLINQLGHS